MTKQVINKETIDETKIYVDNLYADFSTYEFMSGALIGICSFLVMERKKENYK